MGAGEAYSAVRDRGEVRSLSRDDGERSRERGDGRETHGEWLNRYGIVSNEGVGLVEKVIQVRDSDGLSTSLFSATGTGRVLYLL